MNALISIDQEIDRLKAKKQQLMKEMYDVRSAINQKEDKLDYLPEAVNKMKEELAIRIHKTKSLHQFIKPVLGSSNDD